MIHHLFFSLNPNQQLSKKNNSNWCKDFFTLAEIKRIKSVSIEHKTQPYDYIIGGCARLAQD